MTTPEEYCDMLMKRDKLIMLSMGPFEKYLKEYANIRVAEETKIGIDN